MSQQASLSLPTDPPRVQASNKLEWNESRSLAIADFYTIGYSGRDFGAFAKILQSADIQTLNRHQTHDGEHVQARIRQEEPRSRVE